MVSVGAVKHHTARFLEEMLFVVTRLLKEHHEHWKKEDT